MNHRLLNRIPNRHMSLWILSVAVALGQAQDEPILPTESLGTVIPAFSREASVSPASDAKPADAVASGITATTQDLASEAVGAVNQVLTNAVPAASPSRLAIDNTYRLKPNDKFRFVIAEDPIKSKVSSANVVSVTPLGMAEFPVSQGYAVVIPLKATGKTLRELHDEIKLRLEEDYYHLATLSMQLVTADDKVGVARFFGAVKGAIAVEPNNPKSLADAILELGGGNEFANLKKVRIQRRDPATGQATEIVVNVDSILNKNRIEDDVILLDGDRIEVPERSFIF